MSNSNRPNIYEILKDDFKIFDIVIDVGCGELYDLINFEYSEFKTLIGIDNNFRTNGFGAYINIKSKGIYLTGEERREFRSKLFVDFKNRFTTIYGDFLNYNFQENSCSLIICNKVLHFFNDEKKLQIIERFYQALHVGGLLFIKLNHNRHANNINPDNTNHLSGLIYQSKVNDVDIRYLIEPKDFLSKLEGYSILTKHTKVDERTLTFVIIK